MKIVVGLGNPDKKYDNTRHNAGFVFVDRLSCHANFAAENECLSFTKDKKFDALVAEVTRKGEKIILVKPTTYMNRSGEAVAKILAFYKAEPTDIVVVFDDIDLPLGHVRIRHDGSSGGHKGLQNIIDLLGTDKFVRIRLGIAAMIGGETDTKNQIETINFVLGKFTPREKKILNESIDQAIEYFLPYIGSEKEMPVHSFRVVTE